LQPPLVEAEGLQTLRALLFNVAALRVYSQQHRLPLPQENVPEDLGFVKRRTGRVCHIQNSLPNLPGGGSDHDGKRAAGMLRQGAQDALRAFATRPADWDIPGARRRPLRLLFHHAAW